MKILFIGAGPLASVYAHLIEKSGEDVTILARGRAARLGQGERARCGE